MSLFSHILSGSHTTEINASQMIPENGRDASAYLSSLSNGQTITGKIVGLNGNQVLIDLGNGSYVNAKLDSAMDLSKGQFVSFEVKTGSNQQVTLSPLYTNLTQDSTASKALLAANMAVTNDTLSMTSAMMDAGMPIDKNSLGDMYHLINSFPKAQPNEIVEMTKMGIEVNHDSIQQFQAFTNYENQIVGGMNEIMNELPKAYQELLAKDHPQEAMQFMKELTGLLTKDIMDPLPLSFTEINAAATENNSLWNTQTGMQTSFQAIIKDLHQFMELFKEQITVNENQPTDTLGESKTAGKAEMLQLQGTETQSLVAQSLESQSLVTQSLEAQSLEPQSPEEQVKNTILRMLQEAHAPEALVDRIAKQPMSSKELLQLANVYLEQASSITPQQHSELQLGMQKLFGQSEFMELIKQGIRENWMMQPEAVEKKQNIENLYQRLTTQTKALTSLLAQLPITQTTLSSNLSQMNQNLNFMNQMNQMAAYIQLPLKMSGQDTTGDLYVYTNKKNLAAKDGNVSAMLHLDMAHLGMVDVYATMSEGKKVSTKFYLANEKMLDFIGQNIHILNERLEKRGYQVSSEMALQENLTQGSRKEPVQSIPQKVISKQSFDMRA